MKKILDGWRKSTMVLFYKNNGVIQNYVNYKDKKRFSEIAWKKKKNRERYGVIFCAILIFWALEAIGYRLRG